MLLARSINGYDVGGPEPLCLSRPEDNGENLTVSPSCPSPLDTLTLTVATDLDPVSIEKGVAYPAQIFIEQTNDFENDLWARFLMCDASWPLAACHPLIDWYQGEEISTPPSSDDTVTPTDATTPLIARAMNATQLTAPNHPLISTEFFRWPLFNDTTQQPATIWVQTDDSPPPGLYTIVLHLHTTTIANNITATNDFIRWDVGAALTQTVEIKEPPFIRTVSDEMRGIVATASFFCGLYALVCSIVVARNRNHAVMKLAQAPFLLLLTTSALAVFSMLFTILPTMDWHCRFTPLLLNLPALLVIVTLNARLWRVYQTLSVVGQLGRRGSEQTPESRARKCCRYFWCCCCLLCQRLQFGRRLVASYTWLAALPWRSRRSNGPSLRRAVTNEETASLIVMLMLPGVVAAVLGVSLVDRRVILEIDAFDGRFVCGGGSAWAIDLISSYTTIMTIFCLVLAWMSRELPSAFNEKNALFQAAGITLLVQMIIGAYSGDVEETSTHPDYLVITQLVGLVFLTALVLVLIVQPKINRVWSGKPVVISDMLRKQADMDTSETTSAAGSPYPRARPSHYSTDDGATEPTEVTVTLPMIHLQKNDPLPRKLELSMYQMLSILRDITRRSSDGRPLRHSDWDAFQDEVFQLSEWVKRIHYETEHGEGDEEELSQEQVIETAEAGETESPTEKGQMVNSVEKPPKEEEHDVLSLMEGQPEPDST